MLLVMSGWRLARNHIHLNGARYKELLLVLVRVVAAAVVGCLTASRSHHAVLEGLGRTLVLR